MQMHASLQRKFSFSYIAIILAVLILLNTYPLITSEKSMNALSLCQNARSRFRSVMSQSRHRTLLPMEARAKPMLAVNVVFPVPPLPDTTAMILPIVPPYLRGDFLILANGRGNCAGVGRTFRIITTRCFTSVQGTV